MRIFGIGHGDGVFVIRRVAVDIGQRHRHGRCAEAEEVSGGSCRRIRIDSTVIRSAVGSPGGHRSTGTSIAREILRSRCSGVSRCFIVGDADIEGCTGREAVGIIRGVGHRRGTDREVVARLVAAGEQRIRTVIGGGRCSPAGRRTTSTGIRSLRHAGRHANQLRIFGIGHGDGVFVSRRVAVDIGQRHRHGRCAEAEEVSGARRRCIRGDSTVIRSAVGSPGGHRSTGTSIIGEILRGRCSGVSRCFIVADADIEGSTGRETVGII